MNNEQWWFVMATRVFWTGTLNEGLIKFQAVLHERLSATMHYTAASMESYAKTNAPWVDRTGNARNGLKGVPIIVPLKSYGASLSHSVPYGIWLEVRWAGRYSIIMPTIRHESVKVIALLKRIM